MAFATNFDKHVKEVLDEKAPEYEWKQPWSPKGQPWKVDVAGCPRTKGRRLVLIETELKREGPLSNVVKIWRWAHESNNRQRILFLHAFSEHFWKTKRMHRERAIFVAGRMVKDRKEIDYREIRLPFTPMMVHGRLIKKGGGRMLRAARILAGKVAKLAHSA